MKILTHKETGCQGTFEHEQLIDKFQWICWRSVFGH